MEFLETSDCIDESRNAETCLPFKMKKHFIMTRKISQTLSLSLWERLSRYYGGPIEDPPSSQYYLIEGFKGVFNWKEERDLNYETKDCTSVR